MSNLTQKANLAYITGALENALSLLNKGLHERENHEANLIEGYEALQAALEAMEYGVKTKMICEAPPEHKAYIEHNSTM